MINIDIHAMRLGVLYTNTLVDTQPLTDDTDLDLFIDLDVLVLRGCLIYFPYGQAANTVKEKFRKRFVRTSLLPMA